MLIPLHLKSHYSLGHGTASIAQVVERAARLGLTALGLTDLENIYGQVTFHHLSRERGLRPVTGVELRPPSKGAPANAGRIVLLARNRTGYENICRIVTRRKLGVSLEDLASLDTPPEPPTRDRIEEPLETLTAMPGALEGLFVLTDDPSTLDRFLSMPSLERRWLRLLLVRPGSSLTRERALLEASRRSGVALVADPDIDFLDPTDRRFHCLKVAIGGNLLLSQLEEEGLADQPGRHFPGPRECERLFADLPEAIRETHRIAEECELDLRKAKPIFPRIPLAPGETSRSRLEVVTRESLHRLHPRASAAYSRRLEEEIQVIDRLGFCEYFLVVGDIVRFARERGIEVVGRGSGAGSLVAHVLGITNVDPLEHRLYFERFLHEGRSDLPDIDIDLCWIRRDEVIDYVYRTYGHDRVAMISSHNTFQPRSAFREAIKALGVPMEQVNRHSRKLPAIYPEIKSASPLRELILSSPLSRQIPLDEEPYQSALPLAERLLNQPRHLSIHPGGIVIGDRPIDRYVALERAQKGIVVTQYDMYSIEEVGLVKIDLLGNRCLTELQETLELAGAAGGGPPMRLASIPDRDPPTVETLQAARTIGCFQLESPAMRALLSKVRLKDIRGCIAALAIIRPGAAAGAAKETYIRRANGEEPPAYLHPSLESVLEESYGVVIYEEDVMCISSAIAGITLAEGDRLRSAIKKCRHQDEVDQLREEFLRGAASCGVGEETAQAVWKELCRFAAYCFSKAHASGYGVLAYQAAYLKTHFPVEFGCALLNNHAGMYSTRTIAEEIKRMEVRILNPSANLSQARFTVERGAIRTGLAKVKGFSTGSLEAVLEARRRRGPFRSLADFLDRVPISRREVEALILAGGFDDLPAPPGRAAVLNQPQLLWELWSTAASPGPRAGAGGGLLDFLGGRTDHPELAPYGPMTRIQNELEFLGMAITGHPMRLLREEAAARGCLSTRRAAGEVGRRVSVAGIVAATREIRTRKGKTMQFVTIEDELGLLEATLFPSVHRAFSARLSALGPYLFEGKIEADRRAVNLNISRIAPFEAGSRRLPLLG